MDSLASNEEQAIRADPSEKPKLEEDDGEVGGAVASRREFFHEAEEVCNDLRAVVDPALAPKACREVCERIGETWTQYQEQPGLLDPFLEEMIEPLIGAIGSAVRQNPKSAHTPLPNLHLLSSLLYMLTTVRGYKTVARFFPHEAADLEPCLEAAEAEAAAASTQTWSTLYCLTLWLSMVLLTPFDLQSIDSGGAKGLAARILELGMAGLRSTSRTRDASAWMLAKYFTRPDVTVAGALSSFLRWSKEVWSPDISTEPSLNVSGLAFARCGVFQAWSQMLKAVPRAVLRPFWGDVVGLALSGPCGQGDADFDGSAVLQKLRVKVACRAGLVALPPRLAPWRYERGQRSLLVNFAQAAGSATMFANTTPVAPEAVRVDAAQKEAEEEEEEEEDVPEQIEDIIEILLASLSNPDTVVRWAAAKGVGRITNRLSLDFGDQMVESLLERCFSFRETDKAWHGGCLALAELTRRGLLLPERLPTVVPLVCQALHFEQVVGNHAVGQHVRDAACYVCWAFARAYAPGVLEPFVGDIANALIQVAVYDREINCRRAAAAAVQEHVGRQGNFPNGIEVVTVADYFTLSVRRQAYLVVAPQLAEFGEYRQSLIRHLVDRKLQHQDLQIRILASQALAKLAEDASETTASFLNMSVLPTLLARAAEGLSTGLGAKDGVAAPAAAGGGPAAGTVASRHGAVAAVSALVDAMKEKVTVENQNLIRALVPNLEKARAYRGRGGEVVRQAACGLLGRIAAAQEWQFKDATCKRYLQSIDDSVRHTTDAVQTAAVGALQKLAHLRFSAELCNTCIDTYLGGLSRSDEMIAARRGYALCLGALPHAQIPERRSEIISILCREMRGVGLPGGQDQDDAQTRQYAVLSAGRICMSVGVEGDDLELVISALEAAMADYAVDRRGDVGSWVREVAMEVITAILDSQRRDAPLSALSSADTSTRLLALLFQQSVEKIDRLREHAYGLLHFLLCSNESEAFDLELAYRRVCHVDTHNHIEYFHDLILSGSACPQSGAACCRAAWPPAHADALGKAISASSATVMPQNRLTVDQDDNLASDEQSDSMAALFETFVSFLSFDTYRFAIARGLVVSIGGITESTAKHARKALFAYMQEHDTEPVCDELLRMFEQIGVKDVDLEAKRVLAPLFQTLGLLLAQDVFPADRAPRLFEKALAAIRSSRDLSRLKSSIAVFVGLLRWPGVVRRKAFSVLLQFLGYSFPVVRQATAQAVYIRLLEEQGDFDLPSASIGSGGVAEASSKGTGADESGIVPAETLQAVLEVLSITPWGTSNEEALAESLRDVYAKMKFELPTGGRSILAPKKKVEQKPKENEYADLVRNAHY